MFSQSVLSRTGQMWKFWFGISAVLVGSIVPVFEESGMSWTVGSIIAVVGYGFSVAMTRCPQCQDRWLWKALLDAGLYGPLFKKAECPSCKHAFD